MRHDNAANHARGHAPACRMRELLIAFFILIFDAGCLGKASAEIMRRAGLQRFTILHHRFDAVGGNRAGKAFIFRLLTGHNGHGQRTFGKGAVHFQCAHGFLHRVIAVHMGRMPFLPQKLAGAQEHTCPHFPAHNIGPLVDHQWQIAPALHPTAHRGTNHRFRSWANDKWFL